VDTRDVLLGIRSPSHAVEEWIDHTSNGTTSPAAAAHARRYPSPAYADRCAQRDGRGVGTTRQGKSRVAYWRAGLGGS
jgi:hypothetical protein